MSDKKAILAAMRQRAAQRYAEMQKAGRSAAVTQDVDRWPPLPGQAIGDAKDEETRILEAGFSPERFALDREYQARPEIKALAGRYVKVASERERRERTEAMLEASRQVAANKDEMQTQLRRAEIEQQIGRLQAALDTLPLAPQDDEQPEGAALTGEDAETARASEAEE